MNTGIIIHKYRYLWINRGILDINLNLPKHSVVSWVSVAGCEFVPKLRWSHLALRLVPSAAGCNLDKERSRAKKRRHRRVGVLDARYSVWIVVCKTDQCSELFLHSGNSESPHSCMRSSKEAQLVASVIQCEVRTVSKWWAIEKRLTWQVIL